MAEQLIDAEIMRCLEQLSLASRRLATGRQRGERRSRRRGTSSDFADYRPYVSGDDLRYLDWKIYARLERLFLKLFLEEEDLRVNILLDCSTSMGFGEPTKLLYAKRLAAAVGYICLCRMDNLCCRGFTDGLQDAFGPKRGKVNAAAYFDYLTHLAPGGGTAMGEALRRFATVTRGKGIVIVVSDFLDFGGYEEALRLLFGRNFEVYVIHVLAPEERQPELKGDLRLVDSEFAVSTDISVGQNLLKLYERTFNTFCNGLKDYLTTRGGHYLMTTTDYPFDRLVLEVLCRRGLVQ